MATEESTRPDGVDGRNRIEEDGKGSQEDDGVSSRIRAAVGA